MPEASQVRAQLQRHLGPLLRLVPTSAPVAVPHPDVPDHHWTGRGASGWIESKLIPASGRCPDHFTLGQLMWGEEEVAAGGRWHLLGLVQSSPARWVLYDTVGARAWFEGISGDRWIFSVSGRFPTRELLRALVGSTRKCIWKPDSDGIYKTSCGHAFAFTDAGPQENDARFCIYCGNPLKEHGHA